MIDSKGTSCNVFPSNTLSANQSKKIRISIMVTMGFCKEKFLFPTTFFGIFSNEISPRKWLNTLYVTNTPLVCPLEV